MMQPVESIDTVKVLVVEDEPRLRANLEKALAEEGYAVDGAADGPDAVAKAEASEYQAIILDIMLPGMDGWEVLSLLRKTKATPVLMLTARDTLNDRVRGLDNGADDYLVKPFDLGELLARLRALIRRCAGQTANQIQIGDVLLDTRKRAVLAAGRPVSLTAREFSILEYLALHRGKIISRARLHEHLFDQTSNTLSNLVDVHIFSIRRKLGAQLITTRRGQGYCIE